MKTVHLHRRLLALASVASLALVCVVTGSASAPAYTAISVGSLGGTGVALAVNNMDQVAGQGWTEGFAAFHSFFWKDGVLTDIGTLGGRDTVLGSAPLNDRGQVVGLSQTAPDSSVAHAFLWQQGEMRDLGTLGGENSVATAINSSGQIAGWSGTAEGETHAFIWKNGVMKDIGTLGGTTSMAEGINEHGDVVGESTTATGEQRVFLWRNGVMKDLGTPVAGGDVQAEAVNDAGDVIASAIVGRARGSFFSSHGVATMIESFGGVSTTVQALNNRGQVVGGSQGADGNYHAFQWHKGKMTDLGTLGGGSFSFAAAENDSGTVAGSGDTEGGHMHGFVWSHGELIDLGTPGNDSFANAINERGDVAGSSGDDATLWVRNG